MKPIHKCPTCGATVRNTKHAHPLDPRPHPAGTVTVDRWGEEPQVTDHGHPSAVPNHEPLRYRVHQCPPPGTPTAT